MSSAESIINQQKSVPSDVGTNQLPLPEWLNDEFVEKALRETELDSQTKLTCLNADYANPPGENFGSEILKITVELIDKECITKIMHLIVKFLARGGYLSSIIHDNGIFYREGIILQELTVSMSKLFSHLDNEPFCAKCYLQTNEPTEILVLEDLTSSGFSMAKRHEGLDLAHSILVMKTIAKFHATSAVLSQRNPSVFTLFQYHPIIKKSTKHILNPLFEAGIKTLLPKVKEWDEISDDSFELLKKLSNELYDRVLESVENKPGHFSALIHGDLWVNNMMFKYNGDQVTSIRFVDFQDSCIYCPTYDLHYFFETSINDHVYKNYKDKLILMYHNTLIETLHLLKYDGELYSLKHLEGDMLDHSVFAIFAMFSVLPIILAKPEDKFQLDATVASPKSNSAKVYLNPLHLAIVRKRLPRLLQQISGSMT